MIGYTKNVIVAGAMIIITFFTLAGCRKLVEIDPPIDKIVTSELYNSNEGAASVLSGIYFKMNQGGFATGINGFSLELGLSADELTLQPGVNGQLLRLYQNGLNKEDGTNWSELYSYIFMANGAIEGINNSANISPNVRAQLLGEAKFIRAFCYFYLINVFGDVPLLTTTNVQVNVSAPRIDKAIVYTQILADLKDAHDQLSDKYLGSDRKFSISDRIVPNKVAASAMLARVYLFNRDYVNAELYSSEVINNNNYSLEPLNTTFLKNSNEVIWELERANNFYPTDGRLYILNNGIDINANPAYLSANLVASFEPTDQRLGNWVGKFNSGTTTYYYPYKYKEGAINGLIYSEYTVMFRLGEQYLIRAEARLNLGKLIGANSAAADLNVIRSRAGLNATVATTASNLSLAIIAERQHELFTEWGNRWLDLKRLNLLKDVMPLVTSAKGGAWADFKQLFPIPKGDILTDPALAGHQNPGY